MISHQYRCIFIHIPKTAGTSIEKKLNFFDHLERGVQNHNTIRDIEPEPWVKSARSIFFHYDQPTLVKSSVKKILKPQISQGLYDTYFKFSFVRNSWSRAFSWYKNVIRDENHRRKLSVSSDCSLKDFLLGHKHNWGLRSQLFWLINAKGEIPLDFIGRFENLEKDFAFVCDKIGIEDKQLPNLLVTDRSDYSQYYDQETIDLVYKIYKQEINLFKFEFGQ